MASDRGNTLDNRHLNCRLFTHHVMLNHSVRWEFVERKAEEGSTETARRISIRWKVLQALGALFLALSLFIDWPPPQEAGLPDTSSFLAILGRLLSAGGLLAALRRE